MLPSCLLVHFEFTSLTGTFIDEIFISI